MRLIASAPADSQIAANGAADVTFGVSLIMRSFFVKGRSAFVNSSTSGTLVPNESPPSFTLGQLTLISYPARFFVVFASICSRALQYSSMLDAAIFAIILVSKFSRYGSFYSTKVCTPTFAKPIEFSIPEAVSTIRRG
jgi:hypothetical protein